MALTGTALLTKIQELGDAPRDEVAIACGYVNDKTGKPAFTAFYEAMLQAKGVALAPPSTARKASRGKAPSWEATVAKNGTVPVGGAYTSLLGLTAGHKVRIAHEGNRLILEAIAAPAAPVSPVEVPAAAPVPVGAASPSAGAPEAALAPF
jgi:hypothetical protein